MTTSFQEFISGRRKDDEEEKKDIKISQSKPSESKTYKSFSEFKTRKKTSDIKSSDVKPTEEKVDYSKFDLFPIDISTGGETTPMFTSRGTLDRIKDTAKTGFKSLNAFRKAFGEKEAFREGLDIGLLQTSGAIQTTIGRALDKIADENDKFKLEDGREIDIFPRPKIITDFFQRSADKFSSMAKEDFRLAESLQGATVEDPKKFSEAIQDPEFIARGVGQNLPNLAGALGVGVITTGATGGNVVAGTASTFAVTGALEFGFAYEDAVKFGVAEEDADKHALMVGVANGILDTLPIGRALDAIPAGDQIRRNILRRVSTEVAKQMATESATEGLQEIVANAVAMSYDENRELLEGTPEAIYFGGLMGGGTAIVTQMPLRGLEIEAVDPDNLNERLADSAIKDETGQPLKVYHGTRSQFDDFDSSFIGQNGTSEGRGFYFTDKKEIAEQYTSEKEGEGRLFEVYLDIKKPLSLDERKITRDEWAEIIRKVHDAEVAKDPEENGEPLANYVDVRTVGLDQGIQEVIDIEIESSDSDVDAISGLQNSGISDIQTINDIVTEVTGYDGVINRGFAGQNEEADFNVYVAFNPKQIITTNNPREVASQIEKDTDMPISEPQVETEDSNISEEDPFSAEEIDKLFGEITEDAEPVEVKPEQVQIDTSQDRETAIEQLEGEIKDIYREAGEEKAEEVLFRVFQTLDLSEAGYRVFTERDGQGGTMDVTGVPSTFPNWVSPELRSKELFRTVYDNIDSIDSIKYPEKNASKRRRLYDEILNTIDEELGVDTKPIRSAIMDIYDGNVEFKTKEKIAKIINRRPQRSQKITIAKVREFTGEKRIDPFIRKREGTLLKDRIRNIARGAREATTLTKTQIKSIQEQIIDVLDNSRLSLNDKAKFIRTIKNIQTKAQFDRKIDDIIERVETLEDAQTRRVYLKRLRDLYKKTQVKKQSGKPVGRLTPEIQEIVDEIKGYMKMTRTAGLEKIQANLEQFDESFPPEDIVKQNKLIDLYSGLRLTKDERKAGMSDKPLEDLEKAVKLFDELVEDGRIGFEIKKFNREEEMARVKAKVIDIVTGDKGISSAIKTTGIERDDQQTRREQVSAFIGSTGKSIVGWKDVLDMLSVLDKDSDPYKSFLSRYGRVLAEQRAERGGILVNKEAMRDMIQESYDLEGDRQVIKLLSEMQLEFELGTFVNAEGTEVTLKFTRDELIKRYIELQDPTLRESFTEGMAYTEEIIQAIENKMTAQDIAFANKQLAFYQDYYNGVNEIYSQMYGVNLPKNEFYSPIAREGIGRTETGYGDFLQEMQGRASVTSGSLKSRVKNIKPIKKQGSTFALQKHITHMEHFKAWANKIRDLQTLFNDPEIRTAIEVNHGKNILGVVDSFIDDFARGSESKANKLEFWDKMRGRFSRAVLGVKPSILLKQLTSFVAYADAIPTGSFTAGQLDFWNDPKGHAKFLKENSTMLKTRASNIERDLAVAMKSGQHEFFRKTPSFWNNFTLNIKLGDEGAIVAGGWSVYKFNYDNAIKEGKTVEEAQAIGIEAFEDVTESTQQSSELAELSFFQRGGTLAKLMTMFMSSPNQYFRKELGAIRNTIAGRGSIKQHAKTIVIFHFVLPMLFQFVSDFFRFDKENQLRAGILGSFNGIFIVGDWLTYLLDKAMGKRGFPSEIALSGIVNDIGKAIDVMQLDDITTEDVMDAMRALAGATGSLTGTPLKQAIDMPAGLDEFIDGDWAKGLAQFLGWSPYVVDQAFEEDVPEGKTAKTKKKTKEKKKTKKTKK